MGNDIIRPYLAEVDRITKNVDELLKTMCISKDHILLMNYYYLHSNLRYFAKVNNIDYLDFYRTLLINRDMGWSEAFNSDFLKYLLKNISVKQSDNDMNYELFNRPKIFTTYHFGSYRLLVYYLVKNISNNKLALIIDSNSFKVAPKVCQLINELFGKELKCIDAEKNGSIFEMINFVKKGGSLMFFIDGNTGIGKIKPDNMIKTYLMNNSFFARRGIAEISYITNTPVVPFYTYRNRFNLFNNTIKIFNTIYPDKTVKRDEAVLNMTQQIYDILSDNIMINIDQWEGWLYFQYYVESSKPNNIYPSIESVDIAKLEYNQNRFGHIMIKDEHYMYDMENRIMYKISNDIYNLITLFKEGESNNLTITDDIYNLVKQNILAYDSRN